MHRFFSRDTLRGNRMKAHVMCMCMYVVLSLARPHLEYASTVWSPHQKYQIDKLEAVQRKVARFIKNCWSREQGTFTKLLADLKWDTLQVRREISRLLMFYKATHGLVDIPLPDTLIPLSVRNTR